MKRREFLLLLGGGAIAVGRPVLAQQKALPAIGFLSNSSHAPNASNVAAFRHGLNDAGYVEGQNVTIEYRWTDGQYDRLPAMAHDLVARRVDVIVTGGGMPSALAAKNATSTIPIVLAGVDNPVGIGLAASLARPGGNVTGFSVFALDLIPKRLELLSELVPQAREIALLADPNNQNTERIVADAQEAARAKGLSLHILKASNEREIDTAFASLARLHIDALIVAGLFSLCGQLAILAARYAVPAMYGWRECIAAGGLVSYGASLAAVYRQSGAYVGRILKGAKPADLPVQQPTKFELVVNLKTANALGLTVPPSILARADEVI
jgi:putative ABC transport system substrate-binding protein